MAEKTKTTMIASIISNLISPFYRTGSTGSFGRLWSSLLILIMICRYWVIPSVPFNPPDSLVNVTLALLAYVFGTKGLDVYRELQSKKSEEPASDVEQVKNSEAT